MRSTGGRGRAPKGRTPVRRAALLAVDWLALAAAAPASASVRPGLRGEATSPRPTSARRSTRPPSTRRCSRRSAPPTPWRRRRSPPPTPSARSSGRRCAGATARAARATRGSTTGSRRTTARWRPVVFTARNGATLSGRVWFTRAGPAKRPGVVIVNGSVQASETLYWFAAQTLAKAGYVVLTFDPQNQGRSDSRGEAPDGDEGFRGPERRAGRSSRRRTGRAGLLPLDALGAVPAAAELQTRAPRTRPSRSGAGGGGAGRRLQPALGPDRHRARRHRRALRCRCRWSPTSGSATRA